MLVSSAFTLLSYASFALFLFLFLFFRFVCFFFLARVSNRITASSEPFFRLRERQREKRRKNKKKDPGLQVGSSNSFFIELVSHA